MKYIVSGYRRSGTSLMMNALNKSILGGHILVYQPALEKNVTPTTDGYSPNPGGLYEVGQAWYMQPSMLKELPDSALVKILFEGLLFLPANDYIIIFMNRTEESILASCERLETYKKEIGIPAMTTEIKPFDSFKPFDASAIQHVKDICRQRKDIELLEVDFDDLIDHPLITFRYLEQNNIPLNPKAAAVVVDSELRRF